VGDDDIEVERGEDSALTDAVHESDFNESGARNGVVSRTELLPRVGVSFFQSIGAITFLSPTRRTEVVGLVIVVLDLQSSAAKVSLIIIVVDIDIHMFIARISWLILLVSICLNNAAAPVLC
jgi:hypothetical protein